MTLMKEEWLDVYKTQSITSSSGQWGELSWKNIIRVFITLRTFLQDGKPESGQLSADHLHSFLELSSNSILLTVTEIKSFLGFEIDDSFGTISLGSIPAECNTQDKCFLKILLGVSKKAFLKNGSRKEKEQTTIVKGWRN